MTRNSFVQAASTIRYSIVIGAIAMAVIFTQVPAMASQASMIQAPSASESKPISFVIEEGGFLPALELSGLPAVGSVTFEIESGNARFLGNEEIRVSAEVHQGTVTLPALQGGRLYDETYIRVVANGETVRTLRLTTVPTGGLTSLLEDLGAYNAAIIAVGEGYIGVDESRLVVDDLGSVQLNTAGPFEGTEATKGLCVRVAWGPGKVNWNFSNPAGAGYSVKPESSYSLIWASGSSQDIDGIYRSYWGCGTAFKVPDSCTATVESNGSISCCCNATLAALGYVCQWVNPGGIGWPNCPL